MPEYRLYMIDGAGILLMPQEFEAANDAEAISMAEKRVAGRQMELWRNSRKVRCWGFPECSYPQCA